jgi:hypothetical protein
MNSIDELDLSEAFKVYAISNTPIFLLKRLRADPATNEISRSFSGEKILAALNELAGVEEKHATDFVRPYVYLVALSKLPEIGYLRAAGDINGVGKWDWFKYIQQVLVESYSPVVRVEIKPPRFSKYTTQFETIGEKR